MKISSIGIIGGTHSVGASFADHLQRKFGDKKKVIVSGRKTEITNKDVVQQCDLVIFAVPIAVTEKVITENLTYSRPDQIWADFTSIKIQPVKWMLKSKAQVCGLHPIFPPMKNITNQKLVITPARISDAYLLQLEKIFEDLEVIHSTPEEHDQIMGVVQGLSHFSDFVTGATLRSLGIDFAKVLQISSPAYRLKLEVIGRMFAQNPELYVQIGLQNQANNRTMESFAETFRRLKDLIDVKHDKKLVEEFLSVREYLGGDFCQEAYEISDKILNQRHLDNLQNSKRRMKNCDLAIFGTPDSHTDEASHLFSERKESSQIEYFKNIFEVFEAVDSGMAKAGIVPYENSTMGSIFSTLDALFERPEVSICGGVEKEIGQFLLAIPGTKIDQIQKIMSHPQALQQSQKWIQKNLPTAEMISESSTSIAGRKIKLLDDKTLAVIGSKKLAQSLGLEILAKDLQEAENKTRFVLIKKGPPPQKTTYTSLVFWFAADQSGNLEKVLHTFSAQNINLIKIDSRRAGKKYGRYFFFVDAEVFVDQAKKKLLPALKKEVGGVRVLGGF